MNRDEQITRIKATHRERLPEPKAGWPPKVRRAVIFIIAHLFDEQLTVGWMKQQCRINGHNFAARFRYYMDKTPKQYMNYHRVAVAEKLLVHPELGGLPVYQVVYKVGFHSLPSLDMTFKKYAGCTPTEFRRKHDTA